MHFPGLIPLLVTLLPIIGVLRWPSYWAATAATVVFGAFLIFVGDAREFSPRLVAIIAIYAVICFGVVVWRLRRRKAA